MKKKVLASLISSLLIICMLGTSVFAAETVVFEENFEIEPVDGFYVSIPELRAYSTTLTASSYSGTFEDSKKPGAYRLTTAYSTEAAYEDNTSLKITQNSTYTAGRLMLNIPVTELEANSVYEFEAYVKSAGPNRIVLDQNANNANWIRTVCGQNSSISESIICADEWQRVTARFSVIKDWTHAQKGNKAYYTRNEDGTLTFYTDSGKKTPMDPQPDYYAEGDTVEFSINVTWADTTSPIYVDNVRFRKIENAVTSTIGTQAGMPTYPLSALAGKDNAQVVMDVKNETTPAKNLDLTLITAHYKEDGSLNQVLNVYETKVPKADAIQHIESNRFSVPEGLTTGEIKTFAWSNAQQLFPYTEATDSTFTAQLTKTAGTSAEATALRKTALPGTDNVFNFDNFGSSSGAASSTYANHIRSGIAKSGARSLHIASLEEKNDSLVTASGVNFPVDPGRKYKVEFYAWMGTPGSVCARISGASEFGDIRGGAKMPVQTWASSDISHFNNTAYPASASYEGKVEKVAASDNNGVAQLKYLVPADSTLGNHARLYGTANQWTKVTCVFETPAADALAQDYKGYPTSANYGDANYWTEFGEYMSLSFITENYACGGAYAGKGAWIDDITVTDIGAADGNLDIE